MSDAEKLEAIERRVRSTICPTFSSTEGMTVQGRISEDDFNELIRMLGDIRKAERERCAQLHESIDPVSDDEEYHGHPGAGAMGAVLRYRDAIRTLT